MIYLLLPLMGFAALPTDFANVYYCPEGYCLNKKQMGLGFVGPQSMFVQCQKEGAQPVAVKTYNYYLVNNKEVDFKNRWDLKDNFQVLPSTFMGAKPAYCCEGYQGSQCATIKKPVTDDKDDKMGCCYNIGYGAKMVECCQSEHDNMKDAKDGMLGASKCPTDQKKIGGATKFVEGVSCTKFKSMGWTTTHTYESYKIAVGTLKMDDCKNKALGHGGKWKKGKCVAPKKVSKVKCKKFKGQWCKDVGCAEQTKGKKKKCSGKPFQ